MKRPKTNITSGLLVFLLLLFAMSGWSAEPAPKEEPVVVRVNGEPITQAALDKEMTRYQAQASLPDQATDAGKMEAVRKKVLNGMVDRVLLLQESSRLGVSVSEEQLEGEMKRFKERFSSPEQFETILAHMKLTEADLRAEYRKRMVIRSLIEREVTPKVQVSEGEIQTFYDQNPTLFQVPERVRASHILVKTDAQAGDQEKAKAKEKIQAIKKRVDAGEDFAKLAIENSDCPSAPKGGDLEYFQRGQMVAPFEDAAFALKPGETSDVVETQFGYHLIKVVDRQDAGTMSFAEMKSTIEEHLKQQKVSELLNAYLAELKSRAKMEGATN